MDQWYRKHKGGSYDPKGGLGGERLGEHRKASGTSAGSPLLSHATPQKHRARNLHPAAWMELFLAERPPMPPRGCPTHAAGVHRAEYHGCHKVRWPLASRTPSCLSAAAVHNDALIYRLMDLLPGWQLDSTDALGLHSDWVEAIAFAWLAKRLPRWPRWESLRGHRSQSAVRQSSAASVRLINQSTAQKGASWRLFWFRLKSTCPLNWQEQTPGISMPTTAANAQWPLPGLHPDSASVATSPRSASARRHLHENGRHGADAIDRPRCQSMRYSTCPASRRLASVSRNATGFCQQGGRFILQLMISRTWHDAAPGSTRGSDFPVPARRDKAVNPQQTVSAASVGCSGSWKLVRPSAISFA